MTLKLASASHLDHHLLPEHVAFLLAVFDGREGFFVATVTLHPDLPDLESALYGPRVGDVPVTEEDVRYEVRGGRRWASRLVALPPRPTRLLTVIAGPMGPEPETYLYTAYGGLAAPREPGDLSLLSWDEVLASRHFWAEHALGVVR